MDTFLGLFDPSLEDESPDIDDINGNVCHDGLGHRGNNNINNNNNNKNNKRRGGSTLGGVRRGPSVAILPDQLPSEPQDGNIEYKLKLVNPNHERFKRLVSQVS